MKISDDTAQELYDAAFDALPDVPGPKGHRLMQACRKAKDEHATHCTGRWEGRFIVHDDPMACPIHRHQHALEESMNLRSS